MKNILVAVVVMTFSMSTLATELDLKSLPPKTKDKIADYVKSCELSKKNNETLSQAHAECLEKSAAPQTDLVLLGGVATVFGIIGFVLGSSGGR